MKSMKNHDDGNNNINNTSFLGFPLSPLHMKMEMNSNSQQTASASSVPTAIAATYFHSQPNLSFNSYCGNNSNNNTHDGAENINGFYSPLPVIMPLKSDGSLCIMEALSRSHPSQVTTAQTAAPKLEDFFGGATVGSTHNYETTNGQREVMSLSLDTLYDLQNLNEKQQLQAQQNYPFYNNTPATLSNCNNFQLPANWLSRNFSSNNHGIMSCMGENGSENNALTAISYGDLHSLTLSMSPGSQSSCVTAGSTQQQQQRVSNNAGNEIVSVVETKKRGPDKVHQQKPIVHRKSIDTFGQRTSQYRGVTRHRWTGRYEAHLWDNSCKKEGQSRKGRQVYLGGYDMEEKAARAYDQAALKYWGPSTHINFPLENYQKELEEMKNMTRQEYVAHLRRKSSGFSRGASMYRGVTRHHQHGRWQARIGRVAGNKDLYLGTFSTQEEAAEAYDVAAIKFRGANAVTNFDITRYDVEKIMASNTLLAGESARRNKEIRAGNEATMNHNRSVHNTICISELIPSQKNTESESDWKMALYQSSQQFDHKATNIIDTYKAQAFSLASDSVLGIDAISSVHHQDVEDSTKMGNHLSNASSLVTSLSSSREGSPDRASMPMLFAMPTSKLMSDANSNVNSWIPTAQLRPAVTLPHMPVFAAWTDA